MGNPSAEAQSLVHGARLFLDAEQKNHEIRCPSFNEHLNAAISCYNHAIKVYMEQDQMTLAAALCLELGKALRSLGQPAEAIPHLQKAADLQNQVSIYMSCSGFIRCYWKSFFQCSNTCLCNFRNL